MTTGSTQRFDWYVKLRRRGASICGCARTRRTSFRTIRAAPPTSNIFTRSDGASWKAIAKRGSFDLDQHAQFSGKDLTYFDEEAKARYRPWVIEPAAGVDRAMLAFMLDAYDEDVVENEERIVLRLDPRLAPVKVAVYPLLRKAGQPEKAQEVSRMLKRQFTAAYDQAGSIGRRYRRQDEVGTPFGITIDHQTMEDDTVTLRDRDSTEQVRFKIAALPAELTERIGWHR